MIDDYPTGVPTSSDFIPQPPWSCVQIGDQFKCDIANVSLVPGASVPIFVKAIVPGDYPGDHIRNCAAVTPIPGEADLANNKACADMRIPNRDPGQPALRIQKTCDGGVVGAAVSCRITVTNGGTAAPSGPVRVNDAATVIGAGVPVQIQTVTPDGAEWTCGPVPADTLSCQIPGAVMTPGTSRHFDVTVNAPTFGRFENCARGSFGPAPGDDIVYPFGEACAEGGTTITVEKTGDAECQPGEPCTFEITITNEGPSGFSGPVRIGDAIGVDGLGRLEGVEITSIEPPFGCSPEPATLPLSCVADLSLGAGESRVHRVTVVIPDDGRFANFKSPVNAKNCVGVLPPATPVARQGAAAADTELEHADNRAVACHPFVILTEVENLCSEGFVLNDAGRCVCPEGTSFRNGQCVGGTTTVPLPQPKPERCTLLPGQIRLKDGRCVCPSDTVLRNNRCVGDTPPPPPPPCRLLPGQIRLNDGSCVCPRDTVLRNGQCVSTQPPVCKLLPGQIRLKDGRCVCPRGTELRAGACRKLPIECPKGTTLQNGRCVDVQPARCPKGFVGKPPNCRRAPIECPKGTTLQNGRCVDVQPARCPKGFVGKPPNCRRAPIECPKGTTLQNGRCVKVQPARCPKGFVGKPPNCRQVRQPVQPNAPLQINPNLLQQLQKRQNQQQIQ